MALLPDDKPMYVLVFIPVQDDGSIDDRKYQFCLLDDWYDKTKWQRGNHLGIEMLLTADQALAALDTLVALDYVELGGFYSIRRVVVTYEYDRPVVECKTMFAVLEDEDG